MNTAGHRERVEGYEPFFGLNEAPFSLAPNPKFLFESASYGSALGQVAHALDRRELLVVVTGEIGTGKTLLCRTVLDRLDRKTFVSVINDPMLEGDDLLKLMLQDFGVISKDRRRLTPTTRHDLVHALQEWLTSLVPLGAHAVVIVDEAQHLQPEVLEQIRLLSNINDDLGTMLQIILVGQPDLEEKLSRPELRQFQQRVSRRIRLAPLSGEELEQYIKHRLAVARGSQAESRTESTGVTFTPDAMQAVSDLSGGVPRVINILCDRVLEAACEQWLRTIDASLISATAGSLGLAGAPAAGAIDPAVRTELLDRADGLVPETFFQAAQPASRGRKGLLWIASAAVLAVVVWFGVRASSPAAPSPATSAQVPAPAASPAAPSATPAAATTPSATPAAPTTTPATTSSTATSPASPAASTPAGTASPVAGAIGDRFEIVVASFRTEARAAAVAAEVTALGLPVRQRLAGDWQQVLAGPFASRAQADAAQQQLTEAGLTGTQIVPTNR